MPIDSVGEDDLRDVILEFITDSDEEDANERPNAIRSGRAVARSEIDGFFKKQPSLV